MSGNITHHLPVKKWRIFNNILKSLILHQASYAAAKIKLPDQNWYVWKGLMTNPICTPIIQPPNVEMEKV